MTNIPKRIVELTDEDLKELGIWLLDSQIHGHKAKEDVQIKVFGIARRLPSR